MFEVWEEGEAGEEDLQVVDGSGELESQPQHIQNADLYLKIVLLLIGQGQKSKQDFGSHLLADSPHFVELRTPLSTLMARKRHATMVSTHRWALGS